MRIVARVVVGGGALLLALASSAAADISSVARCQKKIATAGADFAKRVIVTTLKCTEEVAECQVQCEEGVFGPSCETYPPPCCDPDDRNSNATFDACMDEADEFCAGQEAKIATSESSMQGQIFAACCDLTPLELFGAPGRPLHPACRSG
jgi:hypothetical protein